MYFVGLQNFKKQDSTFPLKTLCFWENLLGIWHFRKPILMLFQLSMNYFLFTCNLRSKFCNYPYQISPTEMNNIENKNIGWIRVLILIVPYFITVGIFQIIGAFIAGVNILDTNYSATSMQNFIMDIFNTAGTLLVLWFLMAAVDKEPFVKLGFQIKHRFYDILIGIMIGCLIMMLGYAGLTWLNEIIFVKVNYDREELLLTIGIFTLVAISEEVLFRGYVLRNLMVSFNPYIALIVSSSLFAILHGFNPNIDSFALFSLFLCGLSLGISYIYTKNLWFPIALHLSWNLFQSLFGFNVSGQDRYSLIEFSINEENLLNGGAFGFEGSYLSIIAAVITTIGIATYYSRRKQASAVDCE